MKASIITHVRPAAPGARLIPWVGRTFEAPNEGALRAQVARALRELSPGTLAPWEWPDRRES